MNKSVNKEIYFHVGIAKTGTTFLQYRVFPKFEGIYYIQRTRYKRALKIIRAKKHARYLVSREFDLHLEQAAESFSSSFPDTKPIIVFRRQDSYIASQYRRFVKNGFTGKFTEFIDLDNDTGFFKKKYLEFFNQIQLLEKYFNPKPLVLFYEDLRSEPVTFIEKLARQLNVSIDIKNVNLDKKHSSYSEKQLKAMMSLGKYINMEKRRLFKNDFLNFFWRLYLGSIRYTTLFLAKFIPQSYFSSEPLINKSDLEKIREYYNKDWEQCIDYSKKFDELSSNE